MKRQWHILKATKGNETAHNCIYFDTETKATKRPDGSERDRLWFGWMCSKSRTSVGNWGPEKWTRFKTVNQFWETIDLTIRPKSKWFIFCHNTSFDIPIINLFNKAREYGWTLKGAVIEAPPTIITLKRDTTTLVFLDTLNWWRLPLKKIGDRIGLSKLEMPPPEASKLEWDTYGKRDTEILVRTMEPWLEFLTKHDLGGFASTLASQAFRTYRHRFMPVEITIDADDATCALSRQAYHGGRVECFQLGRIEGPIYAYDINSMYPAVMSGGFYPVRLLGHYPKQARERWPGLLRDYCVVAQARVQAAMPCYPLHTQNGLTFPTGTFTTTLTTPELSLALKRGELLEMYDIAVYEKAKIFRDFVQFIWKQRRRCEAQGDTVGSWLWKILANSLYGKFGQTGMVYETEEWIDDLTCSKYTIVDFDTKEIKKCRQMAGLLQVMSSEGEARDSFPAIAAHVTAEARCLLWRIMQDAGLSHLLYCDTDSLFVTTRGRRGLAKWVDPAKLGKLKVIGKWDWIHIHALKDYEHPNHIVRKGVRANAVEIAPGVFQQAQWTSLKGLLGEGDMTAPGRKTITKTLKREYKKARAV